jgi:predicted HicB family RNase H-like nuclease
MLYFWYNDVIKYKEDLNMSYTEAQKKASIKYISQKTDDIRLRVPKGLKDKYKYEAEKRGISMTQFIVNCVEKELKNG